MRPKKKILLVGANEDHTGVLKFLLETHHYAATTVVSAAEAEQHLRAGFYDLLLIEYPLESIEHLLDQAYDLDSTMHSLVIAPKLRERPELRNASAVMVGNYCSAELLERSKVLTARKRGPKKFGPAIDRMVALAAQNADRRTA